jgi:hypothetical protein
MKHFFYDQNLTNEGVPPKTKWSGQLMFDQPMTISAFGISEAIDLYNLMATFPFGRPVLWE